METVRLFVYGSLMRHQCNEEVLVRWRQACVPASVRGWLHLRPDGYPALRLVTFGCLGSRDYLKDAALPEGPEPDQGPEVPGELVTLSQPGEALRILDDFEGYVPGAESEYRRVSLRVAGQPCWTYIGPEVMDWPLIESWPPPWFEAPPAPYQGSV